MGSCPSLPRPQNGRSRPTTPPCTVQPLLQGNVSAHALAQTSSIEEPPDTIHTPNGATVDLAALVQPGQWLTDEHINAFCDILQERARGRVLFLNTFFMPTLMGAACGGYDYSRVRRWTRPPLLLKRAGVERIFDAGKHGSVPGLQLVLAPVHVARLHWWLAAVDLGARRVHCLDSARADAANWDPSRGKDAITALVRWLEDERLDKGGPIREKQTARREWQMDMEPDMAVQRDPSHSGDCGMFTCAAADWLVAAVMSSTNVQCDLSLPPFTGGASTHLHSMDMPAARLSMAAILQATYSVHSNATGC